LNEASGAELERIFRVYGEIRESRRLAWAIVKRREEAEWSGTLELAALCEKILGHGGRRRGGPPPPTLCFQALRIAVNDELGQLERALASAVPLLAKGGRIAVISFHSLEDRIVKDFFREKATACKCPPDFPVCVCGGRAELKVLTKKPVVASERETNENPRAACAKLRVAEKV
jgi:16S rRNA (cytosine1402-N4)-methyltransferase